MTDLAVLEVHLHDRAIGTLTRLPDDRNFFAFNRDYIDDRERPTLSLSFKDTFGELITDSRPTQTRLPPFFANLLPFGTASMNCSSNNGSMCSCAMPCCCR